MGLIGSQLVHNGGRLCICLAGHHKQESYSDLKPYSVNERLLAYDGLITYNSSSRSLIII